MTLECGVYTVTVPDDHIDDIVSEFNRTMVGIFEIKFKVFDSVCEDTKGRRRHALALNSDRHRDRNPETFHRSRCFACGGVMKARRRDIFENILSC